MLLYVVLLWWIDLYSKYLQVSCFEQRTGFHNLGGVVKHSWGEVKQDN